MSYKNLQDGLNEEKNLIKALKGNNYEGLSHSLQSIVRKIYGPLCIDITFNAKKCDSRGKPDILIEYNGYKKYISVKTGKSEGLHAEEVKKFILYLRAEGISEQTQKTILLFHYGDGSMDGSGKVRMPYEFLMKSLKDQIEKANRELNYKMDFVLRFVDRVMFSGNNEELEKAQYIFHGNVESGVICSKDQIMRHIRKKNYDRTYNLHIGPVQFFPYARYVNFNGPNEYKRHIVKFKWVHLCDDLDFISRFYTM